MLLQRVNLKGFLAHRGVQENETSGFNKSVELDFRDSALWLIHGPNGSGKSSIFDALTFALYSRVRGRATKFGDFINDVCDFAEVEVEVDIGGIDYQINRRVDRGQGKKNESVNSGVVYRRTSSGFQIEPNTTNAIPSWTERALRLSYENFVCAAILRQGEADSFLKTEPAKRKEQLMKLLDLDVYKRLGKAANVRKAVVKAIYDARKTELAASRFVSDESLEVARQAVKEMRDALHSATEDLKAKTLLLHDSAQAAQWLAEIAGKESLQRQDATILAEAVSITAAVDRHRELGDVLTKLDALWRLRNTLASEQKTLASAYEQWTQAKAELALLIPKLHSAQADVTVAEGTARETHNRKIQIERDKAALDLDLVSLQSIERLEQQIAEAQRSIAPYNEILQTAEAIENDFNEFKDFKAAGQALRPLVMAQQKLTRFECELGTAQEAVVTSAQALTDAQSKVEFHESATKQLEIQIEVARADIEKVSRHLEKLNEKLEHRTELGHAAECPTCGSYLNEPETLARLERERVEWRQQSEALTHELKSRQEKNDVLQRDKKQALAALKSEQGILRQAESLDASARANQVNAEDRRNEALNECDDAQYQAGEYASRIAEYNSICIEFKRLKEGEVEARHQKLVEANGKTAQAGAIIEICQRQLRDGLPQWLPPKRRELRDRAAEIEHQLAEVHRTIKSNQKIGEDVAQILNELEAQQETLSTSQNLWDGRREDAEGRVQRAEANIEVEIAALPTPWNNHPSSHNREELAKLRQESEGLKEAPQRACDLRDAQGRVDVLNAQIETLRDSIEKLPLAHRIAPDLALEQKQAAEGNQKKLQNERDKAANELAEAESDRKKYDVCMQQYKDAGVVFSRSEELAKAFGPAGLQAKIVAEAQRTIGELANATLDKLSQGNWQIDLRENPAGTELEIIARDLGRGGQERPFECLSGGERFRVAISLAIAIGQSACGGQALNTLVIDEGFGALDDLNRDLLVKELRRLSEQVLRGGRIIIVSHQEDVCNEFDFRYKLSRDKDGYAQVERITP